MANRIADKSTFFNGLKEEIDSYLFETYENDEVPIDKLLQSMPQSDYEKMVENIAVDIVETNSFWEIFCGIADWYVRETYRHLQEE